MNDPDGFYLLGLAYLNGLDDRRSLDDAYDCFKKSMDLGNEDAKAMVLDARSWYVNE